MPFINRLSPDGYWLNLMNDYEYDIEDQDEETNQMLIDHAMARIARMNAENPNDQDLVRVQDGMILPGILFDLSDFILADCGVDFVSVDDDEEIGFCSSPVYGLGNLFEEEEDDDDGISNLDLNHNGVNNGNADDEIPDNDADEECSSEGGNFAHLSPLWTDQQLFSSFDALPLVHPESRFSIESSPVSNPPSPSPSALMCPSAPPSPFLPMVPPESLFIIGSVSDPSSPTTPNLTSAPSSPRLPHLPPELLFVIGSLSDPSPPTTPILTSAPSSPLSPAFTDVPLTPQTSYFSNSHLSPVTLQAPPPPPSPTPNDVISLIAIDPSSLADTIPLGTSSPSPSPIPSSSSSATANAPKPQTCRVRVTRAIRESIWPTRTIPEESDDEGKGESKDNGEKKKGEDKGKGKEKLE